MNLRSSNIDRWGGFGALVALICGVVLAGCERDDTVQVDRNRPPETFITQGPEPSFDPTRPTQVFYRVHLYWRGEDVDGTIAGFRFAIDDTTAADAWKWTTKTDSIFRFESGAAGQDHTFLIRAIDNEGKQDATPDTIRFRSLTPFAPTVAYQNDQIRVTNDAGTFTGLSSGDTVLMNSTVDFIWSGADQDGEILSWESVFGNSLIEHERNDTTRTIGPLGSSRHELEVRAIDDAGARSSEGGFFGLTANFDPQTTIDLSSFTSRLERPWLGPDSTLVTQHFPVGGEPQDTIPFGAGIRFDWDAVDPDGPVVSYSWRIGSELGSTLEPTLNTDSVEVCTIDNFGNEVCDTVRVELELNQRSLNGIEVKGRDIHGRIEGNPTPITMFYNLAPTVEITPLGSYPAQTLLRFWFSGDDRDSDPRDLQYSWQVLPLNDFESEITEFDPDSTFIDVFIADTDLVGQQASVIVTAFDQSRRDRPSIPDTLSFIVEPPTEN